MIARIAKAMNKKDGDKGFTLVELLVVVIIIGILAAVAIPIYMNQQKKAQDSTAKSDLANARIAAASYIADNPDATTLDLAGLETEDFTPSPNVTITVPDFDLSAGTFCIAADNEKGDKKTFSTNATGEMFETLDCTGGSTGGGGTTPLSSDRG